MNDLIFEKSVSGRRCCKIPACDVPKADIPEGLSRQNPARLPQLAEVDLVRHYTNLSRKAYGVDNGFYPLGSCTMKYNPKVNEEAAALEGFNAVHPLQPEYSVQGSLEAMYTLSEFLCEITGMDAVTLQPAAGAHGEFTGLSLIGAYLVMLLLMCAVISLFTIFLGQFVSLIIALPLLAYTLAVMDGISVSYFEDRFGK